jgi:hypothetical protein
MWYVQVFGFIDNRGNLITAKVIDELGNTISEIDKLTKDKGERLNILANPEKYNARVIGQGMHFKEKPAKQTAAKNALTVLGKYGYSTV